MIALSAIALSAAGPWVGEPGGLYAQAGVRSFRAPQSSAIAVDDVSVASETAEAYVEIALPADLELTASGAFTGARRELPWGTVFHHTGLADLRVAADRQLWRGGTVAAAGVAVRLPTSTPVADRGEAEGVDASLFPSFASYFPELGEPGYDVTPRFQLGWADQHAWGWGGVGPTFRTHGRQHGVSAQANVGWWLAPQRLALSGWAEVSANPLDGGTQTHETLFCEAKLLGFINEHVGLQVAAGVIPWARQTDRGASAAMSVVVRR